MAKNPLRRLTHALTDILNGVAFGFQRRWKGKNWILYISYHRHRLL